MAIMKLLRIKTGIILEKMSTHQEITSLGNVWGLAQQPLEVTTMRGAWVAQ